MYTRFTDALERITLPQPGPVEGFITKLQARLDAKVDGNDNPPDAPTLVDIVVED